MDLRGFISGGLGCDNDVASEVVETADEAEDGFGLVASAEVIGAEVAVIDVVLEHVPDGGEHRAGDGEDGFLGAASRLQALELGLQVAALDADGCPRGGDQGGLEPGRALAGSSRAAFAGGLIVSRAHRRPGEQVGGGFEARHVDADLGDDDACGDLTDPRHGGQSLGAVLDRRQPFSHGGIHVRQRAFQRVDQVGVQPEQVAVMRRNAAVQGLDQRSALLASIALGQVGQVLGSRRGSVLPGSRDHSRQRHWTGHCRA